MTSGWKPRILTDADEEYDEPETDLGGLNADETFLFPLISGWAWGGSIPSSSRHLICSWVNTPGPGGRCRADSGGGSGSDMVYRYMKETCGTEFEEVERHLYTRR